MQAIKVGVLGAGSWGTALAALACKQSKPLLWARNQNLAGEIQTTKFNSKYLPKIKLPENLNSTSNFDQAIKHVLGDEPSMLILGIPMSGLTEICQQLSQSLPKESSDLHILWTCKGIHPQSKQWPHEIINKNLPSYDWLHTGVISGPSFAKEVAQGLPVALTVASNNQSTGQIAQQVLHGHQARIYTSSDIIGVEVGGAMKNVIAIACGVSDGLRLGTNARAALITRGLAEIKRLGLALGGCADTFTGLTGLGDLVLTATGDLSRNRQVGLAIGQGAKPSEILAGKTTVEGARCAHAALALGQTHKIDLPITNAVCEVLAGADPKVVVNNLLTREPKSE